MYASKKQEHSIGAPLRHQGFRRIWIASLASNFGVLIQGVGAAWAMTELTQSAHMVALVQTASFLPFMLLSLVSGALADMFDRRFLCTIALVVSFLAASLLALITISGWLTPLSLLAFCLLIGAAAALFGPSWQASVSEQVPAALLPQAVSLNSISYNLARSFGPAIGGLIVALSGAAAAFALNAALYLPLLGAFIAWKRTRPIPRLPPEGLGRAVISGTRYILHSPTIRAIILRTLAIGIVGGAISALLPLVAREQLSGGAATYGALLGAFGIGAVLGALNVARIRARYDSEIVIAICLVVGGVSAAIVGISSIFAATLVALAFNGAAWIIAVAALNIHIQISAPRWVAGRALAAFQAAIAGGIAIGALGWGQLAEATSIATALLWSALACAAPLVLGHWLRAPSAGAAVESFPPDLEVGLELSPRSGPVIITIEYRVKPEQARDFYRAMAPVQSVRQRNGAYNWSLARDVADPELWTERFLCPTWGDYLHQRSRATEAEREIERRPGSYHQGLAPRITRALERPFGSVRWREDSPTGVDPPPTASAPGGL